MAKDINPPLVFRWKTAIIILIVLGVFASVDLLRMIFGDIYLGTNYYGLSLSSGMFLGMFLLYGIGLAIKVVYDKKSSSKK